MWPASFERAAGLGYGPHRPLSIPQTLSGWGICSESCPRPGTACVSCPRQELKGLEQPSDEMKGQVGRFQRGRLVSLLLTAAQDCGSKLHSQAVVVLGQALLLPSVQPSAEGHVCPGRERMGPSVCKLCLCLADCIHLMPANFRQSGQRRKLWGSPSLVTQCYSASGWCLGQVGNDCCLRVRSESDV